MKKILYEVEIPIMSMEKNKCFTTINESANIVLPSLYTKTVYSYTVRAGYDSFKSEFSALFLILFGFLHKHLEF